MPITVNQQESIWKKILQNVESELRKDHHVYETFFAETKLLHLKSDEMIILTSSILCKQYLSSTNEHSKLLKSSIKKITGTSYKLKFVLPGDENESQNSSDIEQVQNNNYTFFSNLKINPKYTFDNFVVGECNSEAVRAALMVANKPNIIFNPLFIYSKSGLGKTHLLHAIGNYYKEKHPKAHVLYITTDAFIDEFIKYVHGSQDSQSLKDFFKTVDLLLVDDIQFLAEKKATAEMFFYIFNSLVNNGKQIVLTSDRHPRDLRGLEDRLVSRFSMGLSENMQTPDTTTMLEILKRKITNHGLSIDNYDQQGLLFLAETFCKNVRELEGALNRLLFHTVTLRGDEKVSLKDIEEAVDIMIPNKDSKKNLNEDTIIEEVAKYYNLSSEQIKSSVRTAQIALARRISMYLCRVLLNSTYKQIGKVLNKDHSSVITGVEKVGTDLKTDSQLVTAVNDIKKALKK